MKQSINISVLLVTTGSHIPLLEISSPSFLNGPCNVLPDEIVRNQLSVITLLWCCTNVGHFTEKRQYFLFQSRLIKATTGYS